MKIAIGLVLAFALALSVAPAVAGDTFPALGTLQQANLTALSDDQLATIEGQFTDIDVDIDVDIDQSSRVYQSNSVRYGDYNRQANYADVTQAASVNNFIAGGSIRF
jgi:hypothetical protein